MRFEEKGKKVEKIFCPHGCPTKPIVQNESLFTLFITVGSTQLKKKLVCPISLPVFSYFSRMNQNWV